MNDMIWVLSRTLAQANRFLEQQMREAGLERLVTSHGDVLLQLFQHDGLTMCELAHRVDRDPSTVTVLVKKLAAQGYVTTARSADDRRVVVVSLTNAGRALEERFDRISRALACVQDAGIDPAALATTRDVLLHVQENFRVALDEG